MRALHAALAGVLGIVAVASPGCTAVYSDFEECSLESPRVFESPPCGEDYNECVFACGGDRACEDQCAVDRPDCDQCFTDTYRLCMDELGDGCAGVWSDFICCVEGQCSVTEGVCDDCRALNDTFTGCLEAADPICRPRLNDCLVVPFPSP